MDVVSSLIKLNISAFKRPIHLIQCHHVSQHTQGAIHGPERDEVLRGRGVCKNERKGKEGRELSVSLSFLLLFTSSVCFSHPWPAERETHIFQAHVPLISLRATFSPDVLLRRKREGRW